MQTVYLVSCVSKKYGMSVPAKNMYISDWFIKARKYVERLGHRWFILSAKYGLLDPNETILPYQLTLNRMSVTERKSWADAIFDRLSTHIHSGDTIVFLAGSKYNEFLIGRLSKIGMNVQVPMRGLRIGQQLKWLKEKIQY